MRSYFLPKVYSVFIFLALSTSLFIFPTPWLERTVDAAPISGESFSFLEKVATIGYIGSGVLLFVGGFLLILQGVLYLFTGTWSVIKFLRTREKKRYLQIIGLHLLALLVGFYWLYYVSDLVYESYIPFALNKSHKIVIALLLSAWFNSRLKKLTIQPEY